MFSWQGRLLLGVIALAILPFALTWNITGGAEWRFTLAAYPFYLVAAGLCLTTVVRWAWKVRRQPIDGMLVRVDRRRPIVAAATLTLLTVLALTMLPWLGMREAVLSQASTTIEPVGRARRFFVGGWQAGAGDGCLSAAADRARLLLPLPRPGPYRIALRLLDQQRQGSAPQPLDITVRDRVVAHVTLSPSERHRSAEFAIGRSMLGHFATFVELRTARERHDRMQEEKDIGDRFAICAVEIGHLGPAGSSR
jgi:hypothetical protein